jgi:drug/metabolite transporter (DMT)-like permease
MAAPQPSSRSLHWLGVACGIAAGAWLGAAEAPTKLVTAGFSPFIISLGMVAGVFVARWTVPMAIKGTGYIWLDIVEKKHLAVWAILAGMLWAVANTLTVFAIRNVGLSIAFPLWNTNSLIGLLWGWLLFNELRNSGRKQWLMVLGGAAAIVVGACVLAFAAPHQASAGPAGAATLGIFAALGAGLLWGTMYIPYRKAYISGMNPLSFVTVFTFGELATVSALAVLFGGGFDQVTSDLAKARPVMIWLFLGGFCWVLGDLFQQYAAKYLGIGRGIPLSNTNQLWGLAWGALVFGELSGLSRGAQAQIIAGSLVMIAGAVAISFAEAPETEHAERREAMSREAQRYGMKLESMEASMQGEDVLAKQNPKRSLWEYLVAALALAMFAWLAVGAKAAPIHADPLWMAILVVATLVLLIVCGTLLYRRTRFS